MVLASFRSRKAGEGDCSAGLSDRPDFDRGVLFQHPVGGKKPVCISLYGYHYSLCRREFFLLLSSDDDAAAAEIAMVLRKLRFTWCCAKTFQ